MKSNVIMLCMFWAGSVLGQVSPHVITFFMRPLPVSPTPALTKALGTQKKFTGPGKMRTALEKALNLPLIHAGIYAAYAGMVTHSDSDGQILFERKTADPKLRVLITEDVKAVPVDPRKAKTLYGFILDPKAKAQQYLFERLQDPETELYSWHASAIPLSKDKRIPYDTLIIFADPQHIIVPLGPTATTLNENFMIPDFYATAGHNSALHNFRFLKIRHYFAPVKFDYKFYPEAYQKKIKA